MYVYIHMVIHVHIEYTKRETDLKYAESVSVYICMCTYICMCIYIFLHTYTHIHT